MSRRRAQCQHELWLLVHQYLGDATFPAMLSMIADRIMSRADANPFDLHDFANRMSRFADELERRHG